MSDKLNSTVALAQLIGVEAEAVQLAEEKGNLGDLITNFNNANKVFSLNEVAELKTNVQNEYVKSLVESDNIPSELYNKVKGSAFEKLERTLKRSYDYEGNYDNFQDLVEKLIQDNSKQPNESKKEDLETIAKLKGQLDTFGETMQLNEKFRKQIQLHERDLEEKLTANTNKYRTQILNNKLNRLVSQIPFADNDNEYTANLLKDGFYNTLNSKVEFKHNENDEVIAYNRETNAIMTDKVGNPLSLDNVVKNIVEEAKVPLKVVKQGDNIKSTTYNSNAGFKTEDDVQRHIEENNITNLDEQQKLYSELYASKK